MASTYSMGIGSTTDKTQEQTLFQASVSQKSSHKAADKKGSKQGNAVFMGNMQHQSAVSRKFALAQKTALKKLLDQLDSDVKISDEMNERQDHIDKLSEEARIANQNIAAVNERRNEIKSRYDVAPDSQEQKDLELKQKANAAMKDPTIVLTDEEKERLSNMPALTNYQQDMLLCDEEQDKYQKQKERCQQEILVESATIQATKKALLKTHPMVDARKQADAIMENAIADQIQSLMQEGVNEIDEKNAEKEKEMLEAKAEALEEKLERERAEKKEAEKERQEEELQNAILNTTAQAISFNQQTVSDIQTNIKALIQEQTLLDVDFKGLRVDKEL